MGVILLYTTSFKVDSKKNLHGIFSLHGLEICDRRPILDMLNWQKLKL